MQRAMRQTFQKLGGSSSSLYSYLPVRHPIPKSNPSFPLPPPTRSPSSPSNQFSRVYISSVEEEAPKLKGPFYCTTEEFKRLLIEYKKDKKKWRPYVMEARLARRGKHGVDDEILMTQLGVLERVHVEGGCSDLYGLPPGEIDIILPGHVSHIKIENLREVITPFGDTMWVSADHFPPHFDGLGGSLHSLFGGLVAKPADHDTQK